MGSSIKKKIGKCFICESNGDVKDKYLTAGLCHMHYKLSRIKACEEREEQRKDRYFKRIIKVPDDLSGLIEDADAIFSKYIRLSNADKEGMVKCFTCDSVFHWKKIQCGHYIPRGHHYTRWMTENTKPQCVECNCIKHGNLEVYASRLNIQNPGIIEALEEMSNVIFKVDRDYLRSIISEYNEKLSKLL